MKQNPQSPQTQINLPFLVNPSFQTNFFIPPKTFYCQIPSLDCVKSFGETQKRIQYLGKKISEDGYRDDPVIVKAIRKLKQNPSNVRDLFKLLGFIVF